MDWITQSQDREGRLAVVNTVMNLRVPLHSGNFFKIWCPLSFSGRTLLLVVSWLQEFVWESFASYAFHVNICSYNHVQTMSLNNNFFQSVARLSSWHYNKLNRSCICYMIRLHRVRISVWIKIMQTQLNRRYFLKLCHDPFLRHQFQVVLKKCDAVVRNLVPRIVSTVLSLHTSSVILKLSPCTQWSHMGREI